MRIIIAGGGIAAVEAALQARKMDEKSEIILYSDESIYPYRRPLLVRMISETVPTNRFLLHAPEFYSARQIQIELNHALYGIDADNKQVIFSDRTQIGYDRLILALGSSARRLQLSAADATAGLYYLHNYADIQLLQNKLDSVRSILIIGGGVLGLECAEHLLKRKKSVTVIERSPEILSSNLDTGCGRFLRQQLRKIENLTILSNCQLQQLAASMEQIRCQLNNTVVKNLIFDMALSTVGTTANEPIWLPQNQRDTLHCNEFMLLSGFTDIFAAGDCVDHPQNIKGNYLIAGQMGFVAGSNAVNMNSQKFQVPVPELRSKFFDIPLYCAGITTGEDCECAVEQTATTLQKLYYQQNKLVGCVLIGDIKNAGRFHGVISRHFHRQREN